MSIKPAMKPVEIDAFLRHISTAQRYLEFGCGGSTCAAGYSRVPKITSIDSDRDWVEKCRLMPELQGLDVDLRFVDIGPTKAWGRPINNDFAINWPNYYTSVWSNLTEAPDVVLIDGRWRVSCALQTILHTNQDTKIIIHDFKTRDSYQSVLKYVDVVESAAKLVVLKAKDRVDWRSLAMDVTKYAMDFR